MYNVRTLRMDDMTTSKLMEEFSQFEKHRVEVEDGKLIITIHNPNDRKTVQFSIKPVSFAESAIKFKNTPTEDVDQHDPTFKIGRFEIARDRVNIVAVVPESNQLGFLYKPEKTDAYLRPCVTMTYADAEAGGYQHLLPEPQLLYRNLRNGHTTFPRAYAYAGTNSQIGKQQDLKNDLDANGKMKFLFGLLEKPKPPPPKPVVYKENPSRGFRGGNEKYGHGGAVGHGTTVSQHSTVNTEFKWVYDTKFEVRILVRNAWGSNSVENPNMIFGVRRTDFAQFPQSDEEEDKEEDEDGDMGMEVDAHNAMHVIHIPHTVGSVYVCKRSNFTKRKKTELKNLFENFNTTAVSDKQVAEIIMGIFDDYYDVTHNIKCRCDIASNIIVVINVTTNCQYFYPIKRQIFEAYDTLCDVECLKTQNIQLPIEDWETRLTWKILMDEIKKVQNEEMFYRRLKFHPYKYPHSVGNQWWGSCDICKKPLYVWDRILSIREKDLDFCPACDDKLYYLVQALPQLKSMCKVK